MSGVGILGVGTYLPEGVRGNDWWPDEVVARWRAGQQRGAEALRQAPPEADARARRVVAAMLELGDDPFGGVIERRVAADDQSATDLEAAAARIALERAGVAADEIDLLLVDTAVPEYLLSNTACMLHQRLGMAPTCLAFEVQASAYSFLAQLALARPMIETGRARRALLVQSSTAARMIDPIDPFASRVGDAASAVVLGPVGPGRGVLAESHRTDGRRPRTLVATTRAGRWYDGTPQLMVPDPQSAMRVFLDTVPQATVVVGEALQRAGCTPDQIGFFAIHQGTSWLRRLVQEATGLERARTIDLYPELGYVFAVSIPLVLDRAVREGALADSELVVLMGGGTGMTYGAAVLRWGRGDS